jgi:hypothetical protein
MTTAVRLGDLQILGQLLEERLQLKFFPNGPLQVRCSRRQDILTVMSQHPDVVLPDPQQVFSVLEQAIKSIQPDLAKKVLLYLRVASRPQPYASHSFLLTPAHTSPASDEPLFVPDALPALTSLEKSSLRSDPLETEDVWGSTTTAEPPTTEPPATEPETTSHTETPREPETSPTPVKTPETKHSMPVLVAGASMSLILLFAIVYPLTRPCVLGTCQEMRTAKQLSASSAKLLQEAQAANVPMKAKVQLEKASNILRTIPFWSFYYQEAQSLIQNYEVQTEVLEATMAILKKGALAAQKAQNPPHDIQTWKDIQDLWRDAIAELEQIPEDAQAYPFAQRKLKEYQGNLAIVTQRLKTEQSAQKRLEAARNAAKVAEARQGVAQSLDSWQLVYATWQTSVQALRQIPAGTVAYQEAQPLLSSYQVRLAESRERKTTEQFAASAYNQAQGLADRARNAEQRNQWTQAVGFWRQALLTSQKVPNGTEYHNKVLPLRESYSSALQRAQDKLRVAVTLQKARGNLKTICTGKPKVCDYAVTSDMMTVYITSDYRNKIRQLAQTAKSKNNTKIRAGVDKHIQSLKNSLQTISNNVGVPVRVYDPSGSLIGSHSPN